MGTRKRIANKFVNKRAYPLIKMYSFYKKDIWGYLRGKRLYKFKKAIYSYAKTRRRFYYVLLNMVYKGIKFMTKKRHYKANLFIVKKRIKLFYGSLKDSYIGKLGSLVKRRTGELVDFFFSALERRLDVIVYRSFFTVSVRRAHLLIRMKKVWCNSRLTVEHAMRLQIGDIVQLKETPRGSLFFQYYKEKSVDTLEFRFRFYFRVTKYLEKIKYLEKFKVMVLRYLSVGFWKRRRRRRRKRSTEDSFPFKVKSFVKFMYKFVKFYLRFVRFRKRIKYLRKFRANYFKHKFWHLKFRRFLFGFKFILIRLLKAFRYHKRQEYLRENYRCRFDNKYLKKMAVSNLYGLRLRFRKLYFFLRPYWTKRLASSVKLRYRLKAFPRRRYRYWKFSKNVFSFFKKLKLKRLRIVYAGYPSYLEVNYKTYMILVVKEPRVIAVRYPFHVDKRMFWVYFKTKSYF